MAKTQQRKRLADPTNGLGWGLILTLGLALLLGGSVGLVTAWVITSVQHQLGAQATAACTTAAPDHCDSLTKTVVENVFQLSLPPSAQIRNSGKQTLGNDYLLWAEVQLPAGTQSPVTISPNYEPPAAADGDVDMFASRYQRTHFPDADLRHALWRVNKNTVFGAYRTEAVAAQVHHPDGSITIYLGLGRG
ncbi:hypothetical protein ACIRCZ_18750 [Leifsonia sp. NPDC102414]|uniref:hypothetical protein n=1 Tax=Leifsonia sp. NPDC102414 TaxID=3364124 RepID=UPI003830BFCE